DLRRRSAETCNQQQRNGDPTHRTILCSRRGPHHKPNPKAGQVFAALCLDGTARECLIHAPARNEWPQKAETGTGGVIERPRTSCWRGASRPRTRAAATSRAIAGPRRARPVATTTSGKGG